MKRALAALALGSGLTVAAALGAAAALPVQQAQFSDVEILSDRSLLTFVPTTSDRSPQGEVSSARLVALPPDATWVDARLAAGPAGASARARILGRLRGMPVALLSIEGELPAAGEALCVELRHDGNWAAVQRSENERLRSRSFDAVLGATLPRGEASVDGAYVILTTEEYLTAVAPLADWKRRKGLDVLVVTPATTGTTRQQIQAWLRNAYATWTVPPEYLLIVGDVDDIPTWQINSNPTDLPYTLMDDGDWLPDLLLGRLSVENDFQAQTVINKTVNYERYPSDGSNPNWYRRFLRVAGNYGSETPINTVKFCGSQLERIGFQNGFQEGPYDGVYSPPYFGGAQAVPRISGAINGGVSLVVYRGWAYGVKGWEPPHFITDNIPALENGVMTPVVMSFVCLNGDFSVNTGGDTVCFGEVWTRAGTPTQPKGAVAFIGNGEHWSHTRFNDATAIAYYERIIDPAITTLGALSVAGKLRLMDYFPDQLDETGDEESVEFYFHIYNLLGDPELNFWKAAPSAMTVAHAATISAGANSIEVTVSDAGSQPLEGARVGIVQGGQLLGCAYSDELGLAHVTLNSQVVAGQLDLTVTHPDRRPYEATVACDGSVAFLAVVGRAVDDAAGNNDGRPNPGEACFLDVVLRNGGGTIATGITSTLSATTGAEVIQPEASFPNVPPGGSASVDRAFAVSLDNALEDGQRVRFTVTANHAAGSDLSDLVLTVSAPVLRVTGVDFSAPGYAAPGDSIALTLTLENAGSMGAAGLDGVLVLQDPSLGTVTDSTASWGAIAIGGSASNAADPFVLRVADDVPHGKALPLLLHLREASGAEAVLPLPLIAGLANAAAPVGPDAYGYYAYDSADLFYAQRPLYEWVELSPAFGGSGTEVVFPADNLAVPPVSLPFTFIYYGQSFSAIRIADNGWVSFDLTNPGYQQPLDFYNWSLPNAFGPHSIVAPFYDNLTTTVADSLSGSEYIDGVYYGYDAGAGVFRVEWSRIRHYRPEITDLQTFEVALYDPAVHSTPTGDGVIAFFYRLVNNADWSRGYATIGMEDPSETMGLELSYSGVNAAGMAPIGPGLAVWITTEPPTYQPFAFDGFAAVPRAEGGLLLRWSTMDPRPILAWRLEREEAGGTILLAILPGETREFVDFDIDATVDNVYRLTALHPYGAESPLGPFHSVASVETPSSLRLSLGQSLPNPMRERARIDFVLPAPGVCSLKVYDTNGRLLRSLVEGALPAGPASRIWDGRDDTGRQVPAGIYFYRLDAGGRVLTRKLLVIH